MTSLKANSSEKWLVAICVGWQQEPSLQKAREKGLKILGIDGDPNASSRHLTDLFLVHDIWDAPGCINKIEATGITPCGVASFISDAGMLTAAAIREYFAIPGLSVAQTYLFTNKIRQRAALTAAKVPGPKWISGREPSEFAALLKDLKPPYIIKPADSAGSRGVHKFASLQEFQTLFPEAKRFSKSGEVIVEEFVSGIEYSVESITIDGQTYVLAISERFKIHETSAKEIVSINYDSSLSRTIAAAVDRAVKALGLKDGPTHSEVIVDTRGEVSIVEIACRGGGFLVCDGLASGASGYDLSDAIVKQAASIPVEPPQVNSRKFVCLRYVHGRKGYLRSVSGVEDISDRQTYVKILASPGEQVKDPVNDGDRIALIKVVAETQSEARSRAEAVERRISFDIVSDP